MARKLKKWELMEIARQLAPGGVWAVLELYKVASMKPEEVDGRNLRSPRRLGLVELHRGVWRLTLKGHQVARWL